MSSRRVSDSKLVHIHMTTDGPRPVTKDHRLPRLSFRTILVIVSEVVAGPGGHFQHGFGTQFIDVTLREIHVERACHYVSSIPR